MLDATLPLVHDAADKFGFSVEAERFEVLSEAMLFDHLGEEDAADALKRAVMNNLADKSSPRTPDLGGTANTREVIPELRDWL